TVNLLAYTATFGGGFSATLSLEDGGEHSSNLYYANAVVDPITGEIFSSTVDYGGKRVPDIVAQLRVDQSWGEAAVFAAGHQVRYPEIGDLNAGSDYGWAAGAGVGVNLPFLAGSHIALEGVYADGASNYLGLGAHDGAFGLDLPGNPSDLGNGWSITGEFGVDVTPALTFVAFGSYVDYSVGNVSSSDPLIIVPQDTDFKSWVAGANATYTVVKGLTVAGEVYYQKTDFENDDDVGDVDGWFGGVRIKRVF
ncbi:MAG: porin, partial [Bradyrhizobium sp.]